MMFYNRENAGRLLGQRLKQREFRDPLVLGIPRGGLVIAAAIARELAAELDVVLARKLRAPAQAELAIGGISEDGNVWVNDQAEDILLAREDYLTQERKFQLDEIARGKKVFREIRSRAESSGRSVIVTDDGIATGSTMIAALQATRAQNPHELIVAVPVAPAEAVIELRHWCDEVLCLLTPDEFFAIGQFYEDFTPIEEADALSLLRHFRQPAHAAHADGGVSAC
jgi:putative phosphoribosyl transferase